MLVQINKIKEIDQKFYKDFVEQVGKLKSDQQTKDFWSGILTPAELEQIPKRLQIIKKLKKGMTQRDIAEDLDVGIATVTRGARELKNGRFVYIK